MGFGNQAQAIILAISAFFMAIGTAAATIPSDLSPEVKSTLFVIFWLLGIIGFALKEAVGSKPAY